MEQKKIAVRKRAKAAGQSKDSVGIQVINKDSIIIGFPITSVAVVSLYSDM